MFGNNTIVNNKIEVCTAGSSGGGIFLNRGINTITNNTILVNRANSGGGAYISFGSNTFSANTISNNTSGSGSGGGMYFRNSNSTLTNNIISMNVTSFFGGGIYFDEGTYQLINNTIEDNSASVGGGLAFKGGDNTLLNNHIISNEANLGAGLYSANFDAQSISEKGTFIFNDNIISYNTSNNRGGGIWFSEGSYTFSGNTISSNTAVDAGGGLFVANSTTVFTENTISNNSIDSSTGLAGGGLVLLNGSNTLTNNIFADNTATNAGGIIFQEGTNNFIGNIVKGNIATGAGGGIANLRGVNTLFNNNLFNNTAATGGGIYLEEGTNALVNNSITGNIASTNGGGMYFENSSPTITNTILWNNTADASTTTPSASVFNENSTPTFSYSLIANSGGSASWETAVGTDGGNNIDVNPLFVAPATDDFTLQKGSIAINAGDNAVYQTATGNDSAGDTDLAGNPRLFQSTIDMGAFEADFKQSQWRGTLSEDWANDSNWDEDVPDDQSVAMIRDISINTPHISATTQAEASDLILAENTVLKVNGVLKVTETINNNGQITFTSDDTKTGQFGEFTGTYEGSGLAEIERFIPAKRAFRFFSSPVTTTTSIFDNLQESGNVVDHLGTQITGNGGASNGFDVSGSNNPSMFIFDNLLEDQSGGAAWLPVANTNVNTLFAGAPARLLVRGDRTINLNSNASPATVTTLRAKGNLQIGNFSPIISAFNGNFNLVGNPYQAAVDFKALTITGDINTHYLYVWDPQLNDRGGYATITTSDGSNTVCSNANGYIQPGQAFFIRNNIAVNTPPSITFTEASKRVDEEQLSAFSTSSVAKLNVQLFSTDGEEQLADGIGFRFSENFNSGIDDSDAAKMGNAGENLASVNNNQLFSIEQREWPNQNEEVQLFINSYESENYRFKLQQENINEEFEIFIKDNYLGTQTLIDAENDFNFSIDPSISDSSSMFRFSLVFEDVSLSNENFDEMDFQIYPNPTDEQFYISGLTSTAKVYMYDVLGKEVLTKDQIRNQEGIHIESLPRGVYVVKVIQGQTSFSTKLIVK